ncbi:MAG TPA: hypothetical protein DCQ06_02930, partial [Myxococcales bacterium]|nr:hypothetical protein [Myxococcales bacterium]
MTMYSGRIIAALALVMSLSVSGCGKKAADKKADPAAKAADKKAAPAAAKAEDKKAADKKAAPAAAKAAEAPKAGEAAKPAGPDTENIKKAKAMIDTMAARMTKMLGEVEAAKGDQDKIKAIGEDFKKFAESNKTEGEALNKAMSAEEKKTVESYARSKMAPLMGRFMAVMMKNRPMPPKGPAAAPGAAPAAAAPAAAP